MSDVFDEAVSLAEPARDDFLARLAEREPAVARDVAALLEADGDTEPLLSSAAAAAHDLVDTEEARPPAPDLTGALVGAYRLTRRLGEGGMGDVWEAEPADVERATPDAKVAVKLLKPAVDSGELRLLFRRERELLGRFAHPGIVRLLGGGRGCGGRPFIVMERVEGEPITEYVAKRKLSAERVARLFLKVSDAVTAIHQKAVIHRDLKPANILVTAAGEPKLLDFGVAKLLDEPDDVDAAATAARLTPAYAAPEQIVGGVITEATDVYALGIVLYELLAGRRPFRRRGRVRAALAAEVANERTPSLPARGPIARALGEIVLTALRLNGPRRYGSVAEMAGEIRRALGRLHQRALDGERGGAEDRPR